MPTYTTGMKNSLTRYGIGATRNRKRLMGSLFGITPKIIGIGFVTIMIVLTGSTHLVRGRTEH